MGQALPRNTRKITMQRIALMTLAVALGAAAACQSSEQKQAEETAKQTAKAIEQVAKSTEMGAAQAAKGLEQMAKGLEAMAGGAARLAKPEARGSGELPRPPDALPRPRRLGESQADRRTDDGAVHVLASRSALQERRLAPRDEDRRLGLQPAPLHSLHDVHAGGLREGDVERLREVDDRGRPARHGRNGTPRARTAR